MTGTITDERTVTQDEALPATSVKFRLVVEPLTSTPELSYQETLALIQERQRERGYSPPTREEVDAYLENERSSWEQRAPRYFSTQSLPKLSSLHIQ